VTKSVCFVPSPDGKTYSCECYFDVQSIDVKKTLELNYDIRSFVTLFVPNTNFDEVSFIDNCVLMFSSIKENDTIMKNKTSFTFNSRHDDLQVIDITYTIKDIKFKKYLASISYSIPSDIMINKYNECMDFCGIMKH